MNALRLLMVTSRYWPQVGETERAISLLAEECCRQGARATILTAAWGAEWPTRVIHREMPIVRLPRAPVGGWSTVRYMRAVSRWLRKNRASIDAVYVAGLRHDAYAAIGALRSERIPIVIRAESRDCDWQRQARFGRRIQRRCQQADAFVAATNSTAGDLIKAGYSPQRVHVIPQGCARGPRRSATAQFRAREALAGVNHDLAAQEYAPVAVCVSRIEESAKLFEIVRAWKSISARWPSAKLWIIGDGPNRTGLYEDIVDVGLHHDVFMPGSFDELVDVFQAADVSITLNSNVGESLTQLQAMAAGLPTIAPNTPGNLDIMNHETDALLVPPGDVDKLAAAISRLFETPELARQLSSAARQLAVSRFDMSRAAEAHLQRITQLVALKRREPA